MVNPKFKRWLELAETVRTTVPNNPLLSCPNCNSHNIGYEFIGNIENRVGYFLLWCNDCLEGLHISRIDIPMNAHVIPFEAPHEHMSHIPNFNKVNP